MLCNKEKPMCDEAIYYNGATLWSYWDSSVTSNTLNFNFYTYQSNTQVKLQEPKFKFVIYSKSSNSISFTLTNCELYKYYYTLKKKILDSLNNHVANINKDKTYTDGFVFKTRNNNNIYTTILYNELLDSSCIRFMIGEKEKSILDTDKIYIPLIEFNSLYLTLIKSFDNYCLMSQQLMMLDTFKKYTETFESKMLEIDSVLHNIVNKPNNTNNITAAHGFDNISFDDSNDINTENKQLPTLEVESEHILDNEENISENQNNFDNFLKDNRDGFELDLPPEQSDEAKAKTQKEIVHENFFPVMLLKNDFSNLDKIILNCVNSELPLDSFVNTVYSTCNIDLYDNISEKDKYAINYIVTKNIKNKINALITKKIELPNSIIPMIVEDDKCDQNKIDCVTFLLLAYIYLSKIKNDLAGIINPQLNKSLISYCLKTITSPFVFTHILNIKQEILITCVVRLFIELNKNGFFKKYLDDIYDKTKIKVEFTKEYLSEQLSKIYENIQKLKDKLSVSNFFKKESKILIYEDLDNLKKYKCDIINKIIKIENNKDVTSTDDIPLEILKKYGINDLKYDNNILIKYIKSKHKDFKDIEQIKNINVSIRDIIDKIDINSYPLDVLKALYFWNVNTLPKNITYDIFNKMVEDSNLTESELISMIFHDNYKVDTDFYKSLEFLNK